MGKSILAIGTFTGFDLSTNNIVFTSNSLTTANFDIGITMDEIRGGKGNSLQGYLPHTTKFDVKAEDSLFDLNYVALNCGGGITAGADVMNIETITTTVANTITVTNMPVALSGNTVVYGWYKLSSDTTDSWTTITFTGSSATVSGLASGTTVCVKYFYTNSTARQFTLSSSFVPTIIRAEIAYTLYATSQSGTASSAAEIGKLIVHIPQFQFSGTQSFAVTSSGKATTALNGSALVNYSGSCAGTGYYALIKEVITSKGTFDNVVKLGVADGDIEITGTGTETIQVYAFYNDGTIPSKVDNSLLTFTSGTTATATVGSHTGLVTGVATGTSTITIVATTKTSLSTKAVVTVS